MLRSASLAASTLAALGLHIACASSPPAGGVRPPLVKEELLRVPGLARVTGLAWRDGDGVLAVSGRSGARFFRPDGEQVGRIGFTRSSGKCARFTHVEPFDLDGDGVLEYVVRGGGWQPVGVLDPQGNVRWIFRADSAPNWMTPADLAGDGSIDFVVGLNGGGGVWRLDADGETVWEMEDGNVWRVEVVDVEQDGVPEILHTNVDGVFTVRDGAGRVLDRFDTGYYATEFAVLGPSSAIHYAGDRYRVFDFRGEILAELPAVFAGSVSDFQAHEVRIEGVEGRSIAILESQTSTPVSVLQVFGPDGARIHEELLDEACESLGWLPRGEGGDLLVGCGERVWRYRSGAGEGAPIVSAAEFAASGGLFGSLRPGDTRLDVRRRMDLMELASCGDAECETYQVYSNDVKLRVVPVFEDEALSWVLFAGSWVLASDESRVRRDFEALIARAREEYGEPAEEAPLPALEDVSSTAITHRWRTDWGYVEAGLRTRVEGEHRVIPALIAVPKAAGEGPEASAPAAPAD